MPHSCAVKTCKNKAKTGTALSFHRLPLREPERLKLWLSALNVDGNTPIEVLKRYIVCSEHFVPEDYTVYGRLRFNAMHRFLTPTAVPTVSSQPLQQHVTEDSENNRTEDVSWDSHSSEDTQSVSEEPLPSLQQCDIKVEETEMHPQVKEEQVDECISPDMDADAEDRHPKSEPTADCKLFPSSSSETMTVNNDTWNESDGSSSPRRSVEVFVELEQPPRQEKSCHFCGKSFKRDSYLIRHVSKSHKGHKAFKCLECNKEFEQRYQLVLHIRIHTGEKPFSCDYCDKTFVQNSSRLAHMRVHTGEKPYFCVKTFHTDSDLKVHVEVHDSWKRHISEKLQRQELSVTP
ncbi:hypothetical protein PAMP_001391 [Pampus punctatissimus]